MKKAVFRSIVALVMVLGLTLAMALPVVAQTTSVIMFLMVDETVTNQKGTIHYTITVVNQDLPGATDAVVTVEFYPPGPTGAAGAYGTPVPIDTNRTIAVGDTLVYNWNGDGGAEERPRLQISLPGIPINEGIDEVHARCTVDAGLSGDDDKTVFTTVIWPDTKVTITSSSPTVPSGESVTLTITEQNTGDVDLTDPYVEIWKNGEYMATLAAPPLTGDVGDPGVLNVGETWTWEYDSGPITSTTTFVALGFGTDPADLEVSHDKGFLGERDKVTIRVDQPVGGVSTPVSRLALVAPWIVLAGLAASAAVFVWSRRAQSGA